MSPTQSLSITIGATNYTDNIYEILKLVRPSWDPDSVQFKVFTDGITNQLVGCYPTLKEDQMVLIRIYGKNTEIIINRQAERLSMRLLHSLGMSSPLYCTFNNGMCYGYQVGAPLDENSIRDERIGRLIAKEMVRLHSIKPENVEDPEIRSVLFNGKIVFNQKGLQMISNLPEKFDDEQKQQRYVSNVTSQFNLRQEHDDLVQHLQSCDLPVVFCHNDLLIKNIIYNDKTDVISFIDFEYTGLNCMAFDIANHFNEYAGTEEVDYTRFPNKEYQLNWLRNYLEYSKAHSKSPTETKDKDVESLYVWVQKFSLVTSYGNKVDLEFDNSTVQERKQKNPFQRVFRQQVCTCLLSKENNYLVLFSFTASHLFWGIWALIQSKYSAISFDFLGYAIARLNEYKLRKKEILLLELPI